MNRPCVVCHMMSTVDGHIDTERWSLAPAAERLCEAVHEVHKADAWMCGRRTFQSDFMEQPHDAVFSRKAKVPTVFDFPAAPKQNKGTSLRRDIVWLRCRRARKR